MSCLSSQEKIAIQQQINQIDEQLVAANASYLECLTNASIKTYQFSGGEGSQSVTRRKPKEIQEVIHVLEASRERLWRKLMGNGIVNIDLRRKSYIR